MRNARLDDSEVGIKTAKRNINLKYGDDTILMAESEEELKNLLRVKEESENTDLKLNIQKTKIMASSSVLGLQKSLQMMTAGMKLKDACSLEEKL